MSEPSGAAMSIPVCVVVRSWVIAPTTGRTYRSSPDGAGAAPTVGVADEQRLPRRGPLGDRRIAEVELRGRARLRDAPVAAGRPVQRVARDREAPRIAAEIGIVLRVVGHEVGGQVGDGADTRFAPRLDLVLREVVEGVADPPGVRNGRLRQVDDPATDGDA